LQLAKTKQGDLIKFRVESLAFRVNWEVESEKYDVSEGGVEVLQLFVLAEVNISILEIITYK